MGYPSGVFYNDALFFFGCFVRERKRVICFVKYCFLFVSSFVIKLVVAVVRFACWQKALTRREGGGLSGTKRRRDSGIDPRRVREGPRLGGILVLYILIINSPELRPSHRRVPVSLCPLLTADKTHAKKLNGRHNTSPTDPAEVA